MKTKLILSLSLFVSIIGVAQAQVTKLQTQASIDSLLPSNTSKTITTARLRAAFSKTLNFADVANISGINLSKLAQSGATTGQVPKWNGSTWVPSADAVGSSPTWGSITGTLSTQSDLNSALAGKEPLISVGGLALNKISLSGATEGNVLKISGGVLTYATDATGGGASGNVISTVGNIASLRTRLGAYAGELVTTLGYYTANDGGGWGYIWNPTTLSTDNGVNIIDSNGAAAGAWEFAYMGWINSKQCGAKGDYTTDDTQALQRGIDYIVDKSGRLEILRGIFRITSVLNVGTLSPVSNPYTEVSFTIKGTGPTLNNNATEQQYTNGTLILLEGTGHTAIMNVRAGASRFAKFEDFTLSCATKGGATHGFLWSQTIFSQHKLVRVHSWNATNAFSVMQSIGGTGSNGEFSQLDFCQGYGASRFYYMDATSGQAFNQRFNDCSGSVDNAGIMFEIGGSGLGYGLDITNFSTSNTWNPSTGTGITLLKNNGISGIVNIKGGRFEALTTLTSYSLGTYNMSGAVNIENVHFDGMASKLSRPFIAASSGNTANYNINIHQCKFSATTSDATADILLGQNDATKVRITRSRFEGFKSLNVSSSSDERGSVTIDDFSEIKDTRTGDWMPLARSYNYRYLNGLISRTIIGEHIEQPSGIAENLLLQSNFGVNSGSALAPWGHTGASTFYEVRKIGYGGVNFVSPHSIQAIFRANSGVYQEIDAATFSQPKNTYYYQAVVSTEYQYGGTITFLLKNATTGTVYDTYTLTGGNNPVPSVKTIVTLVATDVNVGGKLRLEILNNRSDLGILNIYSQHVAKNPNASFVATSTSAITGYTDWSQSSDMLRVYGRLMIPHKSDETGSLATTIADYENVGGSEWYVSSTTGRAKYRASSAWNELPNTDFGTAAPTTGSWPRGWIRYNATPVEAGTAGAKYVIEGWQCITAGSPGTWLQKRYLTGN
ncbi:hypothetical protein [Runella defluvii]|uniref:hypothetical protein n=1 Tax=Runella defluvii TaxID=370973 RepID=UPI00160FC638|nr:hypothetical protein [Runella defluvii]